MEEVRREGSHRTFKHPMQAQLITLPHPRRDLPVGTVRSDLPPSRLALKELKMKYIAFVHHEDDVFGISFPDVPGCVTAGDTMEAAIENAVLALGQHAGVLEEAGAALPPPRPYQTIMQDDALADWRHEALIVAVPLLRDRGSPKRVNISMDIGLLEAIDAEARANSRRVRLSCLPPPARKSKPPMAEKSGQGEAVPPFPALWRIGGERLDEQRVRQTRRSWFQSGS